MAKILLVEDDNNLREIYEARLQAEGYTIVSARDGEEALTVAMKERPDLIISDVMMPKISGFDMLDIIRSTEETKNVKVIMMTALSQAEDKARADKLGADKYLVKSQVTLEDVAKVAREVLNGDSVGSGVSNSQPAATETPPQTTPQDQPTTDPPQSTTQAAATPTPLQAPLDDQQASSTQPAVQQPNDNQTPALAAVQQPSNTDQSAQDNASSDAQALGQSVDDEQAAIAAQIESFIDTKKSAPQDSTDSQQEQPTESTPQPQVEQVHEEPASQAPEEDASSDSTKKKVIQPLNDPHASKGPDLDNLLQKEQQKEEMAAIAKDIATRQGQAAEELAAQTALQKAASEQNEEPQNKQQTPVEEPDEPHVAPEVAISDDGNLDIAGSSENADAAESSEPAPEMNYEDAPVPLTAPNEQSTPQAETPVAQPPQPNIPHTNGTSIDGVVQPPQAQQQEDTAKPDPDAIAL
jgi:CheY-like chemotaxis protein